MKYLYDNGFKVLTMSNLKYNQNTNSLYLGDVPGITVEAAAIPVNKSSLTTVDIFQLKILANRQRINVNWYS
jgi:hypothetical protein